MFLLVKWVNLSGSGLGFVLFLIFILMQNFSIPKKQHTETIITNYFTILTIKMKDLPSSLIVLRA